MLASGPFRPASELSALHSLAGDWLVPGIIPSRGLVILASAPKTGKTCFATALARAVARGEPFLGSSVTQSPVLWCAYEETPLERVQLHEGLTHEDPLLIAYPGSIPPLPTRIGKLDRFGGRDLEDHQPPFIFHHAEKVGARLVVIDCLHAAVEGVNLADNAAARAVVGTLRTWGYHLGVSVLLLHHLTKSASRGHQPERFADSAQILAAASCHFFMDRVEETDTVSRVILQGRGRHPMPFPRLELLSEGSLDYRLADEAPPPPRTKVHASDRVLNLLREGWSLTAEEIAKRLRMSPATLRFALTRLRNEGAIEVTDKVRQAKRYALVSAWSENDNNDESLARSCY